MQIFRSLSAAATAFALMTGAALAGPHIKIFDGARTDAAHRGEIEILSWSWGETNDKSSPQSTGPGVLRVQTRAGKHSEQLARWSREQTRLGSVEFVSGGDAEKPYKLTLRDVLISSYRTGGSAGDTVPMESVSFNYAKIERTR